MKTMSLEGELVAILRLSWLLRAQVGGKMGKLTLLGGLRGPKLDLRGALGPPKEKPRGPKSGLTPIEQHPTGIQGVSSGGVAQAAGAALSILAS